MWYANPINLSVPQKCGYRVTKGKKEPECEKKA